MSRKSTVLAHIARTGLGLEIGPSHSPIAPKKEGYRVEIIDHLSREGLLSKYQDQAIRLENIEEVDHIWRGQTYSQLTGKRDHYDWIIASHLIEHTPDLIAFLNNCAEVLKKDGVLSLVIPDKRYCFDHYRPLTGLSQIIDAHELSRSHHTPGTIAEYFLNVVHKDHSGAWDSGTNGRYQFVHSLVETQQNLHAAQHSDTYIDVHAWCFVPHSFRLLIRDLNALGLIDMQEIGFSGTVGSEFYITLGKSGEGPKHSRLELLEIIEQELSGHRPGRRTGLVKRFAKQCLQRLRR